MVEVVYKPTFIREYKKLPRALQEEAKEKIALFRKNPKTPSLRVHKLKGRLKGYSSFSVNYKYRIVFQRENQGVFALLAIGDHDVYS